MTHISVSKVCHHCPASRTTLVATRFRVAVICPIIQVPHCIRVFFYFVWFLVSLMGCCLIGVKPFSGPMLILCKLKFQISGINLSETKYLIFFRYDTCEKIVSKSGGHFGLSLRQMDHDCSYWGSVASLMKLHTTTLFCLTDLPTTSVTQLGCFRSFVSRDGDLPRTASV